MGDAECDNEEVAMELMCEGFECILKLILNQLSDIFQDCMRLAWYKASEYFPENIAFSSGALLCFSNLAFLWNSIN